MSNKKNLKGLAVASVFALGTTLIAGMPAQAYTGVLKASELTLTPAVGTKYSVPVGTYFDLETFVDSDLLATRMHDGQVVDNQGYAPELAYAIFNSSNIDLGVEALVSTSGHSDADYWGDVQDTANEDMDINYGDSDSIGDIDNLYSDDDVEDGEDYASSASYLYVHPQTSYDVDTREVFEGAVSDQSADINNLRLYSQDAGSVNVVAFLDKNYNGRIDTGEYVSTQRTVTWTSTRTATVTINELTLGEQGVDITATLGADINNAMVGNDWQNYAILLKKNGTSVSLDDERNNGEVVDSDYLEYDYTDGVWFADTGLVADAEAGTYTATVYYNGTAIGTSAPYVLGQGTNSAVDGVNWSTPADSANYDGWYAEDEDDSLEIREGIKTATVTGTVVDDEDTTIAEATKVRVTVDVEDLDSTTIITVGGKTLTAAVGSVTYETTTAADGTFNVVLNSNTGLDEDHINVNAVALSTTGWENNEDDIDVYWHNASLDNVYIDELINDEDQVLAVAADSTFKLNFVAVDQFGQPWTKANFRVTVADTSEEVEMGASAVIANGKAAVTLTDNDQDATSSYGLNWWIETKTASSNTAWEDTVDGDYDREGSLTIYTDGKVATAITVTGDDADVEYADFVAYDGRSNYAPSVNLDEDYRDYSWVAGTATDKNGAAVAGQLVTVSAPGDVAFIVWTEDGEVVTKNSATVRTDSDGSYGVGFFSHKSGDVVVTAKIGSVTKTDTVAFGNVLVNRADTKLTITPAGALVTGGITNLAVSLTDKWGNAAETDGAVIALSVAGNAYVTSNAPTTTDGVANTTLILGATATGATVTAKYAYVSGKYVTALLSLGKSTAKVKAGVKKVTVTVSNAAGKSIEVLVNGKKKTTVAATAAVTSFDVKAKAGKRTVVVKVAGKTVFTKVKNVKK